MHEQLSEGDLGCIVAGAVPAFGALPALDQTAFRWFSDSSANSVDGFRRTVESNWRVFGHCLRLVRPTGT